MQPEPPESISGFLVKVYGTGIFRKTNIEHQFIIKKLNIQNTKHQFKIKNKFNFQNTEHQLTIIKKSNGNTAADQVLSISELI